MKSLIDLPFAIAFGAAYGKITALAAIPVAIVQAAIAVAVCFSASLFNAAMIAQLNAIGFIILFFSGFNLLVKKPYKVNSINMLPGILFLILFNILLKLAEKIL